MQTPDPNPGDRDRHPDLDAGMGMGDSDCLAAMGGGALGALAPALASARRYAEEAKAENTRRAYRSDWRRFSAWCNTHRVAALPASGDTLALYLAAYADAGRKPATLGRAIAAIVQAHKAANVPSPWTTAARAVWQGVRRRHGIAPQQKSPILLDDLRAMLATLGDRPIDVRNRALLLMGFAGALRRSELVGVDVEHLRNDKDGLRLHLPRSKTDQEGQGRIVGLPYGGRPATCPVRAVRAWIDVAGIERGAVFVGLTRGGNLTGARLSGYDVARLVKKLATAAGLNADVFSGHSLRAGFVTMAVRAGKAERAIMQHTGHTTVQMLRRYVREVGVFEDNAATGIGL